MSTEITQFLIGNEGLLNEIARSKTNILEARSLFAEKLTMLIDQDKSFYGFGNAKTFVDHIVAFGPKRVGPNIFLDKTDKLKHFFAAEHPEEPFQFENNILNGAQLALNEGPLAAEPMQGIIVILKKAVINDIDEDKIIINRGKIINQTKALIHKQFLFKSPRLLLAMYTCEIQAAAEVLGKVYAVVQKREGSIISEEMKEGTPFSPLLLEYQSSKHLVLAKTFEKTSGAASPQLVF